jgi:hypothetical protein
VVEVFKTNVEDVHHARLLVAAIQEAHKNYIASFDLGDCDKILRIECNSANVQPSSVIAVLRDFGFTAAVLQNDQHCDPFAKLKDWN